MAKKKKGCLGKLISTIFSLIAFFVVIYIGLGVGDYFGLFVSGKYTTDKSQTLIERTIELKVGGKFGEGSDFEGKTWRLVGNEIYLYDSDGTKLEESLYIQGKVIRIEPEDDLGLGLNELFAIDYYRNGDTDREIDSPSYFEALRLIFAPINYICSTIKDIKSN